MRYCVKDPLTKKESITVTMLILTFLLFVTSVILYFVGIIKDYNIGIMILFCMGMLFAGYHHKRVKISFTGLEIEKDRVD